MNPSGISVHTPIGKLLRLPLRLIPPRAILPILQGPLRGKKWVAGSSDNGCWLGSYEYQKQRLFARSISHGDVVLDIGAHVGFYSLLASVLVGATGRVVAFEPVPENLRYLKEHLRLNLVKNVNVIEAAVSDREGSVWFRTGENSSMGGISDDGDSEVRAVRLDDLLAAGEIAAPSIIKMDIEGGEYRALLGARTLLTKHRPQIFLATHGSDVHKSCCHELLSLGYSLQSVSGGSLWETDEIIALPAGRLGYR